MCHVNPNHVEMLRHFGSGFVIYALFCILWGRTYAKGWIVRAEEPWSFWSAVLMFFLLGMMILIGTYVCQ